jgi:hypothetical protein
MNEKCSFCNKEFYDKQEALPFMPSIVICINVDGINANDDKVYFNNTPYHRSCLSEFKTNILKKDFEDVINFTYGYRMSEIISVVNDLFEIKNTASRPTINTMHKLMNIVCNHNSDYIQCSNPSCKKLLLRTRAIVGFKTKTFQQILIRKQSEQDIKPDDKDYKGNSTPYRVLYFCSIQCDGYFASKLRNILENLIQDGTKKIIEIKDRIKRTINAYECSGSRSVDEINKIKTILASQERVKVHEAEKETVDNVKKVTKEWIG